MPDLNRMNSQFKTSRKYFIARVTSLFNAGRKVKKIKKFSSNYRLIRQLKDSKENPNYSVGIYESVLDGKEVIIKRLDYIYRDLSYEFLKNEAVFLAFLNKASNLNGIKFPKLIEMRDETDQLEVIEEYLPGRMLGDFSNDEKISALSRILHELKILSRKIPNSYSFPCRTNLQMQIMFPWYAFKFLIKDPKTFYLSTGLIWEFYKRALIVDNPRLVLSHRDLDSKNILINHENELIVVDFESMVLAEAETDIAYTARFYSNELSNDSLIKLLTDQLQTKSERANFIRLTIFYSFHLLASKPVSSHFYLEAKEYLSKLTNLLIPSLLEYKKEFVRQVTKKISVTIAVAAYNAQGNIEPLIEALVEQNQNNVNIEKIIVYSDSSDDRTVELAQKYRDSRLMVIDSKTRGGFAKSVQKILEMSNSDFTILLNDDIKIEDDLFVNKYVKVFLDDANQGLITGNPQPFTPKKFLEKMAFSGFKIYEQLRYQNNDGNNILSCDGKTLGLSRKFIEQLKFPANPGLMGNVDSFLYYSCLSKGFKYGHAKNAVVYFKQSGTFHDYIKWMIRNNSDRTLLVEQFGNLVDKESKISLRWFAYFTFKEFVIHPIRVISLVVLGIYIRVISLSSKKKFNPTWDVVSSTKEI